MYTYVSALVKYRNSSRVWEPADLRTLTIDDIIDRYSDVYFTFTHMSLPGRRYCFLNDFLQATMPYSMTLVQALSHIGNRVFPTTADEQSLMSASATYADALQAGWRYKSFRPGTHPDTWALDSQKHDMILYKEGVDIEEAGDCLLGLVNGMAHFTADGYNGLVMIGGGATMRQSNQNHIGLLNFKPIGTIQCVNVTSSMITHGLNNTKPITEDGYLNLGVDLTGKTLILSIGGILYYEGQVTQVIQRDTGRVRLNWHNINHPLWLYDIAQCINPPTLGTFMSNIRANRLLKSAVYDEDNLRAVLDMPQTFAIVVDSPNVSLRHTPVQDLRLENALMSEEFLQKPIIGYSGRLLPYHATVDGGRYVMYADRVKKPVFSHWTQSGFGYQDQITIGTFLDDNRVSDHNVYLDICRQWWA